MFKKYHCVKQHDIKDCAAACLATVSKQYGLKLPIAKIREVAGTDKQGTNALGVIKAAELLGFDAKGVRADQEEFFEDFPLPAIAHVLVDESMFHYVVIHKISKKEVIIADPAKGISRITFEEFFKLWTGVLILLTPNDSFEKSDETTSLFKRFFMLLKPQKKLLLNIFFASIVYTLLGILGAFYFKFLIDEIIPYHEEKTLIVVSIGVLLLTLFKVLMNAYRSHLLNYLSRRIDIPLMLGYYNHVMDLPVDFFGTRRTGEIISRFTDASKIRVAISGATLTIMIDIFMAVSGGIILYMYNATLFSVAVIMLILYGILILVFNKPIKKINHQQMEENAQLTSYLVESLNGVETIKAFGAEMESKLRIEFRLVKLLRTIFKRNLLNNVRNSFSVLISTMGVNIILWVGAYNIIKGHMTVGQLLVFISLSAYFIDPLKNLINLQPMLQTAFVASDRLGEILDLKKEKSEDEHKKISSLKIKGDISINGLDFRYGTRKQVLKDINLDVKAGEKIALVGESGSGKSTLVKLLMRFYDYENGAILIDGYNIRDINVETLRNRIAYVPQETFLFSGSILENLELGNQGVSFEEIINAANMAKAHDFINDLPLRYNTKLEENGSNLSGGQRQRLSIARAIVKKPDLIILDEATSSLDSSTEKAIERTIHEFCEGITSIIIAHRLSTIMSCDRICVFEQGEIVETGTHQSLMAKKGKYYNMWKEQLPENNVSAVHKEAII